MDLFKNDSVEIMSLKTISALLILSRQDRKGSKDSLASTTHLTTINIDPKKPETTLELATITKSMLGL